MAGDNDTFKEQGSSQAGGIAPEDPNSGAQKNQESETIPLSGTVGSMSPEYPKHRDALIICASIIILIVLVVVGYFLVKDKTISFPKIAQEPVQFVRNLLKGGETYGICSNFIRTHKGLFKELGGDLEWSLVKQEIRVVNKDKKARILLKMQGNKSTRFVYFLLKKYGDTWRITSVAMEVEKGKYKRLYPGKKSKRSDV